MFVLKCRTVSIENHFQSWAQSKFYLSRCNITSTNFDAISKHHAHALSLHLVDHPERGNGSRGGRETLLAQKFSAYAISHYKHSDNFSNASSVIFMADLTD